MSGVTAAESEVVSHVETCLRCHGELARYRKMLRMLGQLRAQQVDPPAGLLAEVLGALDEAAHRRAIRSALTGRRLAYGGGIAGALAIAVSALVVLVARERAARPEVHARQGRSEQGAMV
jgi:anti-sigma factor RsiW